MGVKLKPSIKEYKKDKNGKSTSVWAWKHFTPSGTKTEELLTMLKSAAYKKKKQMIIRELTNRKVSF